MSITSGPKNDSLFLFSESLLPDDAKPLLIVDEARLQGNNFCAFAYQRTDAQNVWPAQLGIDLSKP